MLVRGDSLEQSMSKYLVDRVLAADNIEVRLRTEIVRGGGSDHLESLTLVDRDTGAEDDVTANWLYAFIGAKPRTDWLGDSVARDEHGFILTGPDVGALDGAATAARGRSDGRRSCSRRARPGCSPPATCGGRR